MSEDIPRQSGGFASTATACEYTFPRGATFISRMQNSRSTAAATLARGENCSVADPPKTTGTAWFEQDGRLLPDERKR
jgi:hypothetical protein